MPQQRQVGLLACCCLAALALAVLAAHKPTYEALMEALENEDLGVSVAAVKVCSGCNF